MRVPIGYPGCAWQPEIIRLFLAGRAEFFGGAALIPSLLTCPAATINAATMLVALFWGHWDSGFFLDTYGIEYALALLSATTVLIFIGGGQHSLDALIGIKLLEAKDE